MTTQVSHGFPQTPSPLFRSVEYKIENRPGLENQSPENVLAKLSELQAYDVAPSAQGGDRSKREALARFISDWHLVAFLGTTGLLSPVSLAFCLATRGACSGFGRMLIMTRSPDRMICVCSYARRRRQRSTTSACSTT